MTEQERVEILNKSKTFFRENIISHHLDNTKKLSLKSFKRNPFLESYLANYAFGDSSPELRAKVLVYPRLLGTSLNTTFGNAMQKYCCEVLNSYASTTSGMDIEYISSKDEKRKYCQMKASPQTINKPDVKTICDEFKGLKHLARTNNLRVTDYDCVVGVVYGTHDMLSGNYKKIESEGYTVLVGKEFWEDLTDDESFYDELIKVFCDVADEIDMSKAFKDALKRIETELRNEL